MFVQTKRAGDEAEQDKSDRDDQAWYRRAELVASGLMALVTLATGVAVFWQAHETRKAASAAARSADISAEAMRLTQRAALVVTGMQVIPHPRNGSPFFNVKVRNSGRMPALITEYASIAWTDEVGGLPQHEVHDLHWLQGEWLCGPDQEVHLLCPFEDAQFTPELWRKTVEGTFGLGLQLCFRYQTGFPDLVGETGTGAAYDGTLRGVKPEERLIQTNRPGYNYVRYYEQKQRQETRS